MSATLLILGMHRSGTSLCANWLRQCGMLLGDRLVEGSVGNSDGHFEDCDFHDFHEDVFKEICMPYGGLQPGRSVVLNRYFKSRLKALIGFKNELNDYWGWKEPRTCLFLPDYQEVLHNPQFLVLFRSCENVVESLWNRNEKNYKRYRPLAEASSEEDKLLIFDYITSWIAYNKKIIESLQGVNQNDYFITSIDELLTSDGAIISWLRNTGFDSQYHPFDQLFDKSKITASETLELPFCFGLEESITQINQAFGLLAANKKLTMEDMKALDGFDDVLLNKENIVLRSEVQERRTEISVIGGRVKTQQSEIEVLEAEKEGYKKALEILETEKENYKAAIEGYKKAMEGLEVKNNELNELNELNERSWYKKLFR